MKRNPAILNTDLVYITQVCTVIVADLPDAAKIGGNAAGNACTFEPVSKTRQNLHASALNRLSQGDPENSGTHAAAFTRASAINRGAPGTLPASADDDLCLTDTAIIAATVAPTARLCTQFQNRFLYGPFFSASIDVCKVICHFQERNMRTVYRILLSSSIDPARISAVYNNLCAFYRTHITAAEYRSLIFRFAVRKLRTPYFRTLVDCNLRASGDIGLISAAVYPSHRTAV